MGVLSYNIASALTLVTAQRLVRKLCPQCKKTHSISNEIRKSFQLPEDAIIYQASGCKHCTNGYSGRLAVHEVLPMNETFCHFILKNNDKDIKKTLKEKNISLLQENSIKKVIQGETSLSEIQRVVTKFLP